MKRRSVCDLTLNSVRCHTAIVIYLIFYLLCTLTSEAMILVISKETNEIVNKIKSESALGFDKSYRIQGSIVNSLPVDSCQLPVPPPSSISFEDGESILLAARSDCGFDKKIQNAQIAGYSAMIIYNDESNSTMPMFISEEDADNYTIFTCFVGRHDGLLLKNNYSYEKGYIVQLSANDEKFEINWWFILVMALCIAVCVLVFVLCFRLAWYFSVVFWERMIALRDDFQRFQRERRRAKRNRLFAAALKSVPAQKWNPAQLSESCAVCVEEFFVDDELRILSCNHGFHLSCIDEWLINGRRDCPVCKRKVLLENHDMFSNTDSDTDDETAPLLSTSHSQYGNLSGQTSLRRENPFLRGNIQQAPEDLE